MSIGRRCFERNGQHFGNGEGKELVTEYFINGESLPRIFEQHLGDEVLCDSGKITLLREAIAAHLYLAVGGLHIRRFEGRLSHQASICNNTQTPDIDFVGVSLVGVVFITKAVLSKISGAM